MRSVAAAVVLAAASAFAAQDSAGDDLRTAPVGFFLRLLAESSIRTGVRASSSATEGSSGLRGGPGALEGAGVRAGLLQRVSSAGDILGSYGATQSSFADDITAHVCINPMYIFVTGSAKAGVGPLSADAEFSIVAQVTGAEAGSGIVGLTLGACELEITAGTSGAGSDSGAGTDCTEEVSSLCVFAGKSSDGGLVVLGAPKAGSCTPNSVEFALMNAESGTGIVLATSDDQCPLPVWALSVIGVGSIVVLYGLIAAGIRLNVLPGCCCVPFCCCLPKCCPFILPVDRRPATIAKAKKDGEDAQMQLKVMQAAQAMHSAQAGGTPAAGWAPSAPGAPPAAAGSAAATVPASWAPTTAAAPTLYTASVATANPLAAPLISAASTPEPGAPPASPAGMVSVTLSDGRVVQVPAGSVQ